MDGVVAATAMSMVESSAESRRIYDVVIFGASGFTGKYVIREALKHLSVPSSPLKTIALAGRSKSKVSAALQWAASPSTPPSIPIIQADVLSRSSLVALCRQTRVLLNCVGPFQQYGEPVVSACVESGTDYLDITGEPDFMEKIEMEYHTKAVVAGCLVVSACGFDSIPAEIGMIFNSRQWVGASAPNKINAYLKVESEKGGVVGNIGTLASVVQGVASSKNLQRPQRSLPQRADPVIPGGLPEEAIIDHQKDVGVWAVKLPSADAIVVRRTLSILKENPTGLVGVEESEEDRMKRERFWSTVKPAHFSVKLSSKSLLGTVVHVIFGMLLLLFTSFSLGRWLILKYPEVFTFGSFRKTGPTEEEVLCTSFKMWFVGEGYSDVALAGQPDSQLDTQIITRISGPDLGYMTTPIALVQCALIMLGDRIKLPRGGAYPPGIVFGASDLQKRLEENGISFDVISRKSLFP